MSRFLDESLQNIVPYTPGEQPQDMQYIKLNTNESPYAPSQKVLDAINLDQVQKLRLYSDPTTKELDSAIASFYKVDVNNVISGNGSDEILAFAFKAFCGTKGMAFPDVTYGFYPVFCQLFGIKPNVVPLDQNFCINVDDYKDITDTVIIANPNAQTGICLDLDQIEKLVCQNKDRVVIVDEAYVDFGAQTAVPLTKKYDNLLVVQTMSKSRQLAGARVGFAVGSESLINDLKTIKFSFNPYNVNRLSIIAGAEAIKDSDYFEDCCLKIQDSRKYLVDCLEKLGFVVLPSKANFVLAKHDKISGADLYSQLKQKGILVRHLKDERIKDFVRITVGTNEQIKQLAYTLSGILFGAKV